MLRTILKKTEKVLKSKLDKSGIKEKLSKHPNYAEKAREIWDVINKDLGISDTVENKFMTKIDKFEKALLAKFPELTKDDITELKESTIVEVDEVKDVVVNQVDNFKQLQEELAEVKDQLSKLQSLVTSRNDSEANETTTEDSK